MKAVALVIILLSNHGLWFGGEEHSISVTWGVRDRAPNAVLTWQLGYGETKIAEGKAAFPANEDTTTIKLRIPEVRVRTPMNWQYQIRQGDEVVLDSGSAAVVVFPLASLKDFAKRYEGKKLAVIEADGKLSKTLQVANLSHGQLDPSRLAMAEQQDVILVGADQLEATSSAPTAMLGQAKEGASVLVFAQPKLTKLIDLTQAKRTSSEHYQMVERHPLLNALSNDNWNRVLAGQGAEVLALQLPVSVPGTELIAFPSEGDPTNARQIDTLLVVQAVGKGRIVYCQLPLTDFEHDPAARLFLAGALDYLLTAPEATPPPNQRLVSRPATPAPPTIQLEGVR